MDFREPPRPARAEAVLPMINLVFLLLIFFLLTAQIAPSTPFPVTPPQSRSEIALEARDVLYVSADGELAWNEARGEAVWPLIAAREAGGPVEIRADAATSAAAMAGHLQRLRNISDQGARLVVGGS